jgi:ABC-type spermidine/putrescine transport system permease subunit II
MPLILPYVILSIAIAIFGANRKFGFWGYFFGSILLTPAIGLILVLASDRISD